MTDILIKMALLWVIIAIFAEYAERGYHRKKERLRRERIEMLAALSEKEHEPYLKGKKEQAKREEKEEVAPAKDHVLARYKRSVTWFCRYVAEVTHMIEAMEEGKAFERRRLLYALSMSRQYKYYILRDKKELGMEEDLSAFSTEQKFDGFELKGGRLIREKNLDRDKVESVARKWIRGFPEQYDAFHFEVGTLLCALDKPLSEEYYPKEWQKPANKKSSTK